MKHPLLQLANKSRGEKGHLLCGFQILIIFIHSTYLLIEEFYFLHTWHEQVVIAEV
jgi:hypothetical protein